MLCREHSGSPIDRQKIHVIKNHALSGKSNLQIALVFKKFLNKSEMGDLTNSKFEIQFLLDQNAYLIKSILRFQSEGRIMDAAIYKARFQKNLEKLTYFIDQSGQNNAATGEFGEFSQLSMDPQVRLSKFVHAIKDANSLKNLRLISEITGIEIEQIVPLAKAYISFLKRKNQFTEAQRLESDLSLNESEET